MLMHLFPHRGPMLQTRTRLCGMDLCADRKNCSMGEAPMLQQGWKCAQWPSRDIIA